MKYQRIIERVKTTEFAKILDLEIISLGKEHITLSTININRPGIQLTGYYTHFGADRIQIMGEMEFAYLKSLTDEQRYQSLDKYFSYPLPCLIISTNLEPMSEMVELAQKHQIPLLRSAQRTTFIFNDLVAYLNELLAPTITMHGVLMDMYGVGVLITGNSGIGKSENALELIQRGHRLVADDAVIIKRVHDRLIGSAPENIRYLMEVRGIGIIDVRNMYGVGAVKLTKVIDMVLELERWDDNKEYDRLGITQNIEILGHHLPKILVPVRPGRNLAVILEVAARDHRLKSMGFSALDELNNRLMKGDN
ncbi:MAG TPA: HPr(Ser) kinase/phosphatase [Clostridiales bacterium]|nr:HPr(Ser) kinase/phosphatase [Clostridiales bacterium]